VLSPGGLDEWTGAATDWAATVSLAIQAIEKRTGEQLPPNLSQATTANSTEPRTTDWPAVPARIRACLGNDEADLLCDAQNANTGDVGRRVFQEEYAEWRVVRDRGRPVRFELTTELSDYWTLLAGHAPERAIEEVARFARTDTDSAAAIFGSHDPFGRSSVKERSAAFAAAMLGGTPGPFNNGLAAITCLSRGDNTLAALINLVAAAAAVPQHVVDPASGEIRFPSGSEAIERVRAKSAQDCRNSDPVVVERVVRLAAEGRHIRFDDPLGIYVIDVQTNDLLTPDGSPLPREWCDFGRHGPPLPDGLPRAQRIEIEIPPDAGFTLADLRSGRSGERIVHGAQIAELVQVGVHVRCGPPGAIDVDVETRPPTSPTPCSENNGCADVRDVAAQIAGTAA
jgi:hypothetical protein